MQSFPGAMGTTLSHSAGTVVGGADISPISFTQSTTIEHLRDAKHCVKSHGRLQDESDSRGHLDMIGRFSKRQRLLPTPVLTGLVTPWGWHSLCPTAQELIPGM